MLHQTAVRTAFRPAIMRAPLPCNPLLSSGVARQTASRSPNRCS